MKAGGTADLEVAEDTEVDKRSPAWVLTFGPTDTDVPAAMSAGTALALDGLSVDGLSVDETATEEWPTEVVAAGMAQDLVPLMTGTLAAESASAAMPVETTQVAQVRPANDGDGWEYVLSPYLFVPFSVRSDITVGGVTRSVSAGLGDVFNLDKIFSGALRFEARQPQYGFFADASHIFVREGRGVTGFPLPPTVADAILAQTGLPIPPGTPVDASITGTGRTTTVSLGGYYRVVDQVLGEDAASAAYPRLMVDPYLGVRLVSLNGSLDFDVALAGATRTARLSDSTVLFKPMLGAQVGLELSDQWALGLRGDLSGLAIGADDSFAWGLWAGARYQFSPGWALQVGYQYKDANYSLGQGATRFSIDQTQQGIWTGLDIRL
jgi:opacity protein-like surface antigen